LLAENPLVYAMRDGFPVTPRHALIVPNRHVETFFDLTPDEILAANQMLLAMRERIMFEDPSVVGFNIGMNCGQAAGQTIFHCHIHLIPRRVGDVANPRGGVRHLIPGKGNY
jgi:ATP adenylyltransferase